MKRETVEYFCDKCGEKITRKDRHYHEASDSDLFEFDYSLTENDPGTGDVIRHMDYCPKHEKETLLRFINKMFPVLLLALFCGGVYVLGDYNQCWLFEKGRFWGPVPYHYCIENPSK